MNTHLFYELMRFAFSRKTFSEKLKYTFLSVIFYFSLAKIAALSAKSNTSAAGSLSGDDIYPLF